MRRLMTEQFRIVTAVFKRLLARKSFWIVLCLLPTLLIGLGILNKDEENGLRAAVYCEEKGLVGSLEGQTNPVFVFVETIDEVKQLVLTGKVECGYVIPDDLFEAFQEDDWNWKISVYEGSHSMFTGLVNEVLFSAIFEQVSVEWYLQYMEDKLSAEAGGKETAGKERLQQILAGEETFRVQTIRLANGESQDTNAVSEQEGIISVKDIAAVLLYLLSLLTITDVVRDREKGRFRKSMQPYAAFWTIFVPVFLVGLTGLPWLGIVTCLKMIGVTVLYAWALNVLIRKSGWMYGLIPVLFVASLVCCPVFVDMGTLFPNITWIKWLFPLSFCL